MKKIYIVTGANGFLGNNLVRSIQDADEIRCLVLPNDKPKALVDTMAKIYYGDITISNSLSDIFSVSKEDELTVIHAAALVYIKNKPNSMVDYVNVLGTKNVVNKCLETNARLVYVNSVHAIPEPKDEAKIVEIDAFNPDLVEGIYAKSKAKAASLVLESIKKDGLNASIVHPSGMVGPKDFGMTHMTKVMLEIAKGTLPALVNGGYDFVDVRDVASAIITLAKKDIQGECFILSNEYISIDKLASYIDRKMGVDKKHIVLPTWIAKAAAPFCEIYYSLRQETPMYTSYSLHTLESKSNFSHEKATQILGYNPRPFIETVSDTIDWFQEENRLVLKKK